MSKKIKFVIMGTPVAKGRPRLSRYGTYTPKMTKDYEALVIESYRSQVKNGYTEEPIEIDLLFCFEIPKSYSKKRRLDIQSGKEKYTKKPDIDNLIKSILDGLNGVAFKDDNQVINVTAKKVYSDIARVEVEITVND